MSCDVNKVIQIARNEVGYLEKQSNMNLDSKTANAGDKNYTKYARDLDNISGFYNGKKQGFAWCDCFVDWCFVKAYGVDNAKRLLFQPDKSLGAGCQYSMNYYKTKGQLCTSPKLVTRFSSRIVREKLYTQGLWKMWTGLMCTLLKGTLLPHLVLLPTAVECVKRNIN